MELVQSARDAFERRDWAVARDRFIAARQRGPLAASDVEALADSRWWLGSTEEALAGYEEAYHLHLSEDQPRTQPAWRWRSAP